MILFPLADYAQGVHDSAEIDVPDEARLYKLFIARCTPETPDIWPDHTELRCAVFLYLDGSWRIPNPPYFRSEDRAWLPWGDIGSHGGMHRLKSGDVLAESWLAPLPEDPLPTLTGRMLRVRMTAVESARTQVRVEFS